jgi:hypothetical protein
MKTRISPLSNKRGTDPKNTTIGFGQTTGFGTPQDIVNLMKPYVNCAIHAMPTVAKVQWQFAGPIAREDTLRTLGASIDILGSGANPPGVAETYHTPGLINGVFQTHLLACAVGVHLETDPQGWTARGNAFTAPTMGVPASFSPDVFTIRDQATAWGDAAAPVAPAFLRYGTWANDAFWYMVRAYNLRWTYGSLLNILDEQLRDTAYMPPNAQEGSAGTSQQDIAEWVRASNEYYVGTLESPLIFQKVDTLRVGALSTLGGGGGGVFAPSRDFEFVDTVYGGADLRSKLACNSEFRTLSNPYILKPGVPIGLKFEEQNTLLADQFRAQFDAGAGSAGSSAMSSGTIPANFTDFANLSIGAGTPFNERTIDGVTVTNQVQANRVEFKAGEALMSNELKGWEISESLAAVIRDNADVAAALCSECGCYVGWAS